MDVIAVQVVERLIETFQIMMCDMIVLVKSSPLIPDCTYDTFQFAAGPSMVESCSVRLSVR